MRQRVLITGHDGYIGSVMAPRMRQAGHQVTGLDTGYFSECTLVPDEAGALPTIGKDIRDLTAADLEGFDAVVHLAALSNDPIGNLNSGWTESINLEGSVRLARAARAAGVSRFLFSSSCIMYGASEAVEVDENSPLDPRTIYARSKVLAEQAIAKLASPSFSPVFLRNGTVYGLSPRMRFDTVLNSLVGSAVTTGKVVVHGDGKPWRPVVHIDDVASVFLAVLEAPRERIHNQALNAASAMANHQIGELAEITASAIPGCRLQVLSSPEADQRTYKTNFDKIARLLPELRPEWSVRDGIAQLHEQFRRIGLTVDQFRGARFTRLLWLRRLMEEDRLDGNLRWRADMPQAVGR